MRSIKSGRLRLTPVTAQNARALWLVLQEPGLRDYQDLPNVGAAAFSALVARRPKRLDASASGRFEWLMYVQGVQRAVGWVSLRIAEREPTEGEIGYSVLRDHRGQGIATQGVAALLTEAFEQARLRTINAYCVPQNVASRSVLAHLGFTDRGLVRNGATVAGRAVDVVKYAITRDDWAQSANSIDIPASA